MRILFVTQYYYPETGAPQNRLSGLAKELKKKGVDVEVLTAMPNYPRMEIFESYKGKFSFKETVNDIKVYRAWIFTSKNRSIFARLLNYFSFVLSSFIVSFKVKGKFDFVLCESPPLFLGISARIISKRKRARFIFNVSDLWPESAEKLGLVTNPVFLKLAYKLEAWLYRKSSLVSGQTQGICKDINSRFPEVKTHWLPNGIDAGRFNESINSSWRTDNHFNSSDFILLYAGIIGHAQGLEIILLAAEKLKGEKDIKFVLLGDGPEKEKLLKMTATLQLSNVFYFNSIDSTYMPNIVKAIDAAIIPLKKLDLFKGAIPSKIFENLAMEKPILLGVEGEAKELFIEQGRCGLFFIPENADDLAEKILMLKNNHALALELGVNGRKYVNQNFSREKIVSNFYSVLSDLINERH